MEAFDMVACLDDKLLDFGSDVGEEDEHEDNSKKLSNHNSSCSCALNHNCSFPEFAEEELEWLSNKDAFPAVETSFVDILGTATKQQSPVSVLDNSNNSSNSSGSTTFTNGNIVRYCCVNVKVPVKARSKRLRKCRDLRNQENSWWVQENVKNANVTAKGPGSRTLGRKCQHCGAERTPQWRAGPLGPKTLCNACGVRYKSGRLVPEYRPANSPTFSNELHSNSHRKILEMRRQKHLGFSAMKPMDKG
ncbi:GATA transcription factor 1-like [Durio zibethinus]|uniref:GATA transcription factor 1-like n=1 Tax=Durio zibethinus TaxID=66656 RepID=A0A6P6AB04_DURZI|nr:GATA transcription factor 1-like [Durio zibethinus]